LKDFIVNPLILSLLAVTVLSISFAYAEQQVVVELPFDIPYSNTNCQEATFRTSEQFFVQLNCYWNWNISEENYIELRNNTSSDEPRDPQEFIIALGEAIRAGLSADEEQETTDVVVKETTEPEEEVVLTIEEQALVDFEKCFGGIEQAGAFQQAYSFEKFERKYQRSLSMDDRLAEECVSNIFLRLQANQSYPGLEIDPVDQGFTPTVHGLKMSAGIQVDEDKLQAEEDRIVMPSWYVDPYGACITEMIEVKGILIDKCDNRGASQPIIGDAVVNAPDNPNTGKTTAQILREYRFVQAASIITPQDFANLQAKLDTKVCEIAWDTSGQGGIDITKWPLFLSDGWCNDKVEGFIFKQIMTPLDEIIIYKEAQAKTEAGDDLRLHK